MEEEDQHWKLGIVELEVGEDAASRLRIGFVEADGNVVPRELVAERVGPLVLTPDHAHRLEAIALGEVPVVERIGDRSVELLVARSFGADDLELGMTLRDRAEHRGGTVEVAPPDDDDACSSRV